MEFRKKDYLKIDEIKNLIVSKFSHEKAKIIADKVVKYRFVTNDILCVLQDNFTFQDDTNVKLLLINKTSELIQTSYPKLSETDRENLDLKFPKLTIFKNSDIETYYPQLLNKLTKQQVIFNITVGEIHF